MGSGKMFIANVVLPMKVGTNIMSGVLPTKVIGEYRMAFSLVPLELGWT